jgi:hypothetical protein
VSVFGDGVIWRVPLDSRHLLVQVAALVDVSLRQRHQALGELGLGACQQRVAAFLGGELAKRDRRRF